MKNFEAEFVFTCPWFLDIVLLAISDSKKNEKTIHIFDFIFVRNGKDIWDVETFGSDKSLLFSCGSFFYVNICNHYNKRNFFFLTGSADLIYHNKMVLLSQEIHERIIKEFQSLCFIKMGIDFARFSLKAKALTQGTPGASGYDLYSVD